MADKLDKWLSDEQSKWAFRSYQVAHGEDGEKQSYYETRHHLHGPVSSPPAGELVIPAGGEQLLAVGLGNELGGKDKVNSVPVRGSDLSASGRTQTLSLSFSIQFPGKIMTTFYVFPSSYLNEI